MKWKLVVVVVLVVGLFFLDYNQSLAQTEFTDVGTNHWAKPGIEYIAKGGIVKGEGINFFPERNVTRAEAATMIGRTLSLNGTQRPSTLPDVRADHFASGYIQEAVERGIISGYPDGTFKPERVLSRGEMAVLMCRAFGYSTNEITIPLAAQVIMAKGISNGIEDGTFGINRPITRSELSVLLARAINPDFIQNYQAEAFDQANVSSLELELREGPVDSYQIVNKLYQGVEVNVHHIIGEWAYIKMDTLKGYVKTSNLSGLVIPPPPPPIPTLEDLLKLERIIIDPGHGGNDPGASGFGLQEKNVVLDVSLKVKSLFAGTGFSYSLTRETDIRLEVSERVNLAKQLKGSLFVSIHANAFNGIANGTETFYYAAATNPYEVQSKKLAGFIQKRMLEAWNLNSRGVKNGNYKVLRENNMPASLVELGFVDSKEDAAKLASDEYRLKAAKAIYLGILDYYQSEKKYDLSHLYKKGL